MFSFAPGTPTAGDPFAGITDEAPLGADVLRSQVLDRLRRTAVPLRKSFVQKPPGAGPRASLLGDFVNGKKHLPLRLFLLIHAVEPLLSDTVWTLEVWTDLVGGGAKDGPSRERVSAAMRWLQKMKLIDLHVSGAKFKVYPLKEDGSGDPFVRVNSPGVDVGHGYFTIPTEFWRTGLSEKLALPGYAMLLVALSETSQDRSFQISQEQMSDWYGISERTAERGYGELSSNGLLLVKKQLVNSVKSSTMRTVRYHRALSGSYSTDARAAEQEAMRARIKKKP